MKFSEKLNEYISLLSCTSKDLYTLADISAASFTRYRKGERVPELRTPPFDSLCAAIAKLAAQKGLPDVTAETVKESFTSCEDFVTTDKERLRQNFNTLLTTLNINLTRLCQYTNYDASTIFRIRNGSRKPGDPEQFASAIASFTAREMRTPQELSSVAELLGCEVEKIYDQSVRYTRLKNWLLERQGQDAGNDSVAKFLNKLDAFDLNEYIKVIRFDELKVPTMPFQLPSSKAYFGITEMMESELDFLKATVLSKSMAPVTMYSCRSLRRGNCRLPR